MNYLYLLLDMFSCLVPFLFSFHPKLEFYKKWPQLWPAILVSASLFIMWDALYTHLGIWWFNPRYLMGFNVYNLPIEEVLFFVCIPYSCVFTYYCLAVLIEKDYFQKAEKYITILLVSLSVIIGLLNLTKIYTSVTFILLAIFLVVLSAVLRVKWLSRFYFAYMILLIPFLLVNGVLTGTGIEEAIVNYDNSENLGFRIMTIPIEDTFYGMLLILLNVFVFELGDKKTEYSN